MARGMAYTLARGHSAPSRPHHHSIHKTNPVGVGQADITYLIPPHPSSPFVVSTLVALVSANADCPLKRSLRTIVLFVVTTLVGG